MIKNLHDLALAWVGLKRTVIAEYSGSIERDFKALAAQVVNEINPLLLAHDAEPINVEACFSDWELEEEEEDWGSIGPPS